MKTTPFWHEAAPPEAEAPAHPPAEADVAIVGAGFTGLSAALALAEAGRSVVVVDKGPPGAGASTRNGGMIGWGHRASVSTFARRYGQETAEAMIREARLSLEFTTALIGTLPGDAMFKRTGRFLGAASPRHFEGLRHWAEHEAPALGMEAEIISTAEQSQFVATDLYHGGIFMPQHGGLHPALFHKALLDQARARGAAIIGYCEITGVSGEPGGWTLSHATGGIRAREIIYAANGYTGGGRGPFGAMARRLIPIPSYLTATTPLGANRISALFPRKSMIVETRSYHSYFRPDPWGERILYGARTSINVIDERLSGRRMRDILLSVFPDLGDVEISHSWRGTLGFTFDGAPHIGQVGGIWHACGYNGSGVAMAPYLGWRLAQRLLGTDQGATGFDPTPFAPQPLYGGNPWFLNVVEAWMKVKDRWEGVKAVRRRR